MSHRVAIFASVSTPAQASDDKDSLPSQLRDGRLWTDQVGGTVVTTFEVPGHSRRYIFFQEAERDIPAYRELREACKARGFDVLWCRARDRLGRTDALIAQVEALVASAGAEVYSALLPHQLGQSSEASAIYLSAIERAAAQTENIVKTQRHKQGMRARVRRGLHAGTWPHGYRAIRNGSGQVIGAEFVPEEIGAVHLATDLFIRGHGYHQITQELNASPWRPRRADRWPVASIRRILCNDTYAGILGYNDVEVRSELFPVAWDRETYRAIVQERRRRYRGNNPPATAASGLVFCARCGWRMQYSPRWGEPAYRCRKHAMRSITDDDCHCNYVTAQDVLEAIGKTLATLDDPQGISEALAAGLPDLGRLERETSRAHERIEDLNRRRQRLALALADGTMAADVYRSADDLLAEQLDAALRSARDSAAALSALPDPHELERAIAEVAGCYLEDPAWLMTANVIEARTALQRIGLRVMCEESEIVSITLGNRD